MLLDYGYKVALEQDCTVEELQEEISFYEAKASEWDKSNWAHECMKGDIKEYNELKETITYIKDILKRKQAKQ